MILLSIEVLDMRILFVRTKLHNELMNIDNEPIIWTSSDKGEVICGLWELTEFDEVWRAPLVEYRSEKNYNTDRSQQRIE